MIWGVWLSATLLRGAFVAPSRLCVLAFRAGQETAATDGCLAIAFEMFVATEKTCEERRAGGLCGPGDNARGLRVTHNEEETRMGGEEEGRWRTGSPSNQEYPEVWRVKGGRSTHRRDRESRVARGRREERREERRGEGKGQGKESLGFGLATGNWPTLVKLYRDVARYDTSSFSVNQPTSPVNY